MTSHAFYNNVAPFPSRSRPTPTSAGRSFGSVAPSSSHPFPQPPLRSLPSFGSPNEFPNASGHYFPSRAGAYNRRQRSSSAEEEAAAQDEQRRPPGPFPDAGGGKMRSRDRTTWDAGSELMRDEQEEQEQAASNGDEMDMDEGDAVSVRSKDAESTKDSASVASGKDTTKKRSRTLTTAHQTAVLNALLAKTRFPSTETREEVGQQIGMSARRVQIWFQNRRQSQKRARDREASEMGSTPTSHHHGYEFPQRERTDNPYTRYAPAPAHSSASSSSTVRPDLSRQTSMDSLASRSSFASARSSHSSFSQHQAARDTLSPLSDGPPRWPGAPSFGNGWGQLQQQQQHPPPQQVTSPGPGEAGNRGSMYFPPAGAPTSRQNSVDEGMRPSEGGPVKLPSLSAVLGGAIPPSTTTADGFSSARAPPRQVTFNHPQPFSPPTAAAHRPPPPAPSSGARNYGPNGMPPPSPTTSQANASSRPFDDGFSRLRISSEGPISPTTRQASPPDLLDAAMETVYRPSKVNPPRSSLPPLRFTHSGRAIHTSEADAALLAPILPPITLSGASTPKTLPPLSSLALSSPTHPFPSRASTWSQQSGASTSSAGHTRSSVSSFDWGVGPTLAAPGASGSSFASSSRTSFSSEVQEEWDRIASASAGRKVKTEVTGGFGGWEPEAKGRTVGATQALMSDVRMQS